MAKFKRKPHRIRKKNTIWKNRFFRLSILLFILTGTVFYCLVFFPFFHIKEKEITILDNEKVLAQDLKDIIKQKTKSIFLADLSSIEQTLLEKFIYLEEINIKREWPDGLTARIKERIAIGLWCGKECYLVDKEGMELGEISLASTTLNLVIHSEQGAEKDKMTTILEIDKKIDIEEFIILADRLTAKTTEGWEIYFDLEENISQQLFNLEALLEEQISFNKYIDLRFGNRVYYK